MKKVIFVGQAMPRVKRDPHDWPSLNDWLFGLGITIGDIRKNFFYTALVDYFPGAKNGGHLVPKHTEIEKERERLKKDFLEFDPEMVVTVGKLSATYCLGKRNIILKNIVGRKYSIDPYGFLGKKLPAIPLPHPSGASTWYNQHENKKLLNKALSIFKTELNI